MKKKPEFLDFHRLWMRLKQIPGFTFAPGLMKEKAQEIPLQVITLSHHESPVEVREIFAFDGVQAASLLQNLREVFDIQEALILSTCNRTEIYYLHESVPQQVLAYLLRSRGAGEEMGKWFQCISDTTDAVWHLLRVGAGLESRVLGDFQIINQVKNAYQLSADLEMAGPFLHRLLHSLFFLNKRIVQETSFRSGSASVSYACKELVEDLLSDPRKPIALLGLGETGRSVALNLIENGYTNLRLCNRSPEKAEGLLSDTVQFVPFENWQSCVEESSLVISALSGQHLQIKPAHLENSSVSGFRYFIDLGVPRSIDPALESDPRVILYNIDQIQKRVDDALDLRRSAITDVEAILEKGLSEFMEWTREMQVSPLIQQMKQSLEAIRKEEMARFLKKASPEQIAFAEDISKGMVQRILKTHVVQLKAACRRGDADSLVEGLRLLFQVEESSEAE
jgi:glutamyl-tRNA reductase